MASNQSSTVTPRVVSSDEWLEARKAFLVKEKEFTRLRDELTKERRALPWERVNGEYVFDSPAGKETLSQLFGNKSQLIVYHFMFAPENDAGCPNCSLLGDGFNRVETHLAQRDASFVVISRAPLEKLQGYKKRLGWDFKWVSSGGNSFNRDYLVLFTPEEISGETPAPVNYGQGRPYGSEEPGLSVFTKDKDGQIFHTYSTFRRGLEHIMPIYSILDLTPKGRDELWPMEWVRRHDEYDK